MTSINPCDSAMGYPGELTLIQNRKIFDSDPKERGYSYPSKSGNPCPYPYAYSYVYEVEKAATHIPKEHQWFIIKMCDGRTAEYREISHDCDSRLSCDDPLRWSIQVPLNDPKKGEVQKVDYIKQINILSITVVHRIYQEKREKYVEQVKKMLLTFTSICQDVHFLILDYLRVAEKICPDIPVEDS